VVPRVRRTGAIMYLVMLAFVAFMIGDTFKQAMTVIAVLGWITVAALAVYMVLFKGVKFTLFKDEAADQPQVTAFQDGDKVVTALDPSTGDRTIVVEASEDSTVVVQRN
jgi:hypothetical protein